MPTRIRLSRAKGWRIPENTVKVDRSTLWGNPFVVGADGDARYCVEQYTFLMAGYFSLNSTATIDSQRATKKFAVDNIQKLRGYNLACWCALNQPCHADILLKIANGPLDA